MNRKRARAGLIPAAILLVLAASCLPGRGGSEESGEPPAASYGKGGSLESFYTQDATWRSCRQGFECTTIRVPLDYAHPNKKALRLAVARLPATGDKIGSLVVNPGGPGGSGVDYARSARVVFPRSIRARFDVVGFDPRGVGRSDPPVECVSDSQLERYLAIDSSPDSTAEEERIVRISRKFAGACGERSEDLLRFVGTPNVARDMDVLRAVLDDSGLTYLGKSYGSLLGAYYADLFPRRVRALVLDGAVDPQLSGIETNDTQAKGFETALRAFVADCVERPECPLGEGTPEDGMRRLDSFLAHVEDQPLDTVLDDGRKLNQALALLGIASALYDDAYWEYLRLGLRAALSENDGTILMQLGDSLVGRRPDGSYTNQMAASLAVSCIDHSMPRSVASYKRAVAAAERAAPHFGEFIGWSSLPCAFWPVRSAGERELSVGKTEPILVIGTTRDPATPYSWATALARDLESGVLLTLKGDGHTAYRQGSACVDRVVDRYLLTGRAPGSDVVCG